MKLMIEIDEARFKDIQRIAEVQLELNHFQTAEQIIASGTVLSDNATNGDAVKTLFSDTLDNFCERTTWEWNRWWNAPYQKGGNECR